MDALTLRQQRLDRLAATLSFALPGVAGQFARRPVALLVGAFCGALGVAGVVFRQGVVSDADLLGGVVPLVFLGLAGLGFVGHATLTTLALAARRKERA